jgi:hypothetical protein
MSLTKVTYSMIDGAPFNVLDYGADPTGAADSTAAIQAAIDAAETGINPDRFTNGSSVYFPSGTYKITSTLTINQSGISLVGQSSTSSVLYAPSADFDLVHFEAGVLALYNVGMSNMRFFTPGNTTAGCHLRVTGVINAIFDNLIFTGWHTGLVTNGCGRTVLSNMIFSQEFRTAGTTHGFAIDFRSERGLNSDVFVDNYSILIPDVSTNPAPGAVAIRGVDGMYFSNCHQNGAVLILPNNETCASVMFSNFYFDKGSVHNLQFAGVSAAYRNFFFNNCYLRDSRGPAVEFLSASQIQRVFFSSCQFVDSATYGIRCQGGDVDDLIINGCTFDGNNTLNTTSGGDITLIGKATISNCLFIGGGANGTALELKNTTSNCQVSACNFVDSTAGTKVTNAGSNNKFSLTSGYITKNTGSAQITGNGSATTVVVDHGLSATPSADKIAVTPRTNITSFGSFWVSNVTATQFTINLNSAPPGGNNPTFSWVADLTF